MKYKKHLLICITIYSSTLALAQNNIPIECRYSTNGTEKSVGCSRISNMGIANNLTFGNVCVFKGGQWQFGELKPDSKATTTYKYKFLPKFICSRGILVVDMNSSIQGFLGPSLGMVFRDSPHDKVKSKFDSKKNELEVLVPGYTKKYKLYDSSTYYGVPASGSSLALKDLDSKVFNIGSCFVDLENSFACVNSEKGSSINQSGFCGPKNLGTGFVQNGKAFKGYWYVRYKNSNQGAFDVCTRGIIAIDAKEQANQSRSEVQLVKDADWNILPTNFVSSYNDGSGMTSGLSTWFGASTGLKVYRNLMSCVEDVAGKKVRYPCSSRSLYVYPTLPPETENGRCYAYKQAGSWKFRFDAGVILKVCDELQAINTELIKPN